MMNKNQVIELAINYIEQSIAGMELENAKFDFKRKWYNLKDQLNISEFLKDTSAMANTFGPDGIIVIGFDDKRKELNNVSFQDCGLRDTSEMFNLINKNVDRQFTINYYEHRYSESTIGILHMPPSIDKPHVIKSYKTGKESNIRNEDHKIFIRKNTQTFSASKYDLELMYYDRKNIIPDYELLCSFHQESFQINFNSDPEGKTVIPIKIIISLENSGRRPVSICAMKLELSVYQDPSEHEITNFVSRHLLTSPVVVNPGQIQCPTVLLYSKKTYDSREAIEVYDVLKTQLHKLGYQIMAITLTNGIKIGAELRIIK